MNGTDLLREAAESLLQHKLRTILAALGIVAGVGTIVAALAMTAGARRQAIADIGVLGIDNVLIRARVTDEVGHARPAPVLTIEDAAALSRRFPRAVVAVVRTVHQALGAEAQTLPPATIVGVTASWQVTAGLAVARGRWFRSDDEYCRCAVIGGSVARTRFGGADSVGQPLLAAGEWRTVIGVIADGLTGATRAPIPTVDSDSAIFVPVRALDVSLGRGDTGEAVDQLVIHLRPDEDPDQAALVATWLLDDRHAEGSRTFDVIVPRELLRARLGARRRSNLLVVGVGALTLLISGVGIMNIMVASVSERAAEIGVRRAVGARRRSVLLQFAAEAACLGGVGGLLGVPLGAFGAWGVARLGHWPLAVSPTDVSCALALAIGVGLAAGVYPARLAASLSPIDALRE